MKLNTNNIDKITKYIFVKTNLERANLCLVFGTKDLRICRTIMELWDKNFFEYLVVSGGINRYTGEIEAIKIKEKLIDDGIPEQDVITEEEATNTGENVVFSKRIIEEKIGLKNIRSIIAVGKIHAGRRYLMTLERHFPKDVKKMLAVYNEFETPICRWFENKEFADRVLKEWQVIPEYLGKGWIAEIEE